MVMPALVEGATQLSYLALFGNHRHLWQTPLSWEAHEEPAQLDEQ